MTRIVWHVTGWGAGDESILAADDRAGQCRRVTASSALSHPRQ
ncbi:MULTISPECIES: hypothetical protein [unclassified Salinibacterium]|nr:MULTISPECIES: hypothetical protein [unclassified Salinibacterium]